MKEKFEDSSFCLIKALHHLKISVDYFDDISKEYNGGAKQLMTMYANKCKWIIDDVRLRIPREILESIDREMEDSLFLDAVEDKLIHFNDQQREMIEQIIDLIYDGNAIEISYKSIDPKVILPESDF